jgi:hypothetical protein
MPDTAVSASITLIILSGARVAMGPVVTGDSSVDTTIVGAVGASDTVGVGAGAPGSATVNEAVLVSRSAIPSAIFASDFTV